MLAQLYIVRTCLERSIYFLLSGLKSDQESDLCVHQYPCQLAQERRSFTAQIQVRA